jgi:hypothetical protein
MIAVDTNLLVYAHREDSPFHKPALQALAGLAGSGRRWGIPCDNGDTCPSLDDNARAQLRNDQKTNLRLLHDDTRMDTASRPGTGPFDRMRR